MCHEKREANELALSVNKRLLLKRTLLALRQNRLITQLENRYSKLFAVFTAWRSVMRENKLLSQYLQECTET